MEQWGSFVVQGIPAIGLLIAGHHRKVGWLICLLGQTVAVTYGTVTGLWGFAFWAPVYIVIYGANWLRWSRKERGNESAGASGAVRHRRDHCPDGQG